MPSNQFDREVLELVNNERADAGIDPLAINSQLDEAANLHTDEMVQADVLSHQLPDEADMEARFGSTGYDGMVVAENLGAGAGTLFDTPEEVVEGWMNSPEHRENILNPEFTDLGVGYESSTDDNDALGDFDVYWTQVFGTDGKADTLAVDNQISQSGQTLTDETQADSDYQILDAEGVEELFLSGDPNAIIEGNIAGEELVFAIPGDEVEKLLDNPDYQEYLANQDFSLGVDGSIEASNSTYFVSGELQDSNFTITGFGAVSPAVLPAMPRG